MLVLQAVQPSPCRSVRGLWTEQIGGDAMTSGHLSGGQEAQMHVHKWDVFITADLIREDGVISRSPKSSMDDILAVKVIQLQGCKCGAQRRAIVGYEKERFRGDDWRRARGLAPLGNLPGSNG